MKIAQLIPILEWLPRYTKQQLMGDLSAGLTVGVMLIPQGMAYAMLAGMPPVYGLYAAMLPLVLYAMFGTSRQLAVGPVAMVSLLVATGVGSLAEAGTPAYIGLVLTLAFMVGWLQFGLGVFRLGFLVNFLSHPVISGFTSAAALVIAASQLKHLLGIALPKSEHFHTVMWAAITRIGETDLPTFAIGIAGIALIMGLKKWKKAFPGQLIAVIFGVVVVRVFHLDEQGVKILGNIPTDLPHFTLPNLEWSAIRALLPTALTISLIGFMESIAVAKAIQAKHKNYKIVANQELIGLGIANIGGALLQSYPVTGGFSRTAVNDQAGAKTGMASIFSAALITLTLLLLTPLFSALPNAILASVILVAVIGLIDVKEIRHLWHTDRADFWMLIVTFVATLVLGIEQGILIGVALSLGWVIYSSTRPHYAILGKIPQQPHYRNVARFPDLETRDDLLIFRFDARMYFANVQFFTTITEQMVEEKGEALQTVIFDMDAVNGIDSSALHALIDFINTCKAKSIAVYVVGAKGPVRDKLAKGGVIALLGNDHFYLHTQQAVDFIDHRQPNDLQAYTLQNNGKQT